MDKKNPLHPQATDYEELIQELKNKIHELNLENFQLKNVVDNLPGDIYWKKKDGVWSGLNKSCAKSLKRMGFIKTDDPKEVIGKTDFEIFNRKTAEGYRKNDLEVMEKTIELSMEESTLLSTGEQVTLHSIKRPLLNKEGNVVGIVGNTIDISYLKKIEADLHVARIKAESANQAKTEFIANMCHDIRTPLTGVIGMSHIMENKTQNAEEKQYAQWINESGNQLLYLLNGILDIVSAEHINDNDLQFKALDLRECIQDIVELELPTVKLKKLELLVDIPENIPQRLICDHAKLHRILLNLVGNAIKFTEKGHIGISIQLVDSYNDFVRLKFDVFDTGIGISDELQSKVFDRFYRVNPSYTGKYDGHGIGLHIAKTYVDLLGSELKLTSQLNKGTSFYFELVLKVGAYEGPQSNALENKPIPNEEIPSDYLIANSNDAPYVLLVEDSPIALKMVEIAATSAGCRYASATDGLEALELAKTEAFDLIITDIGLPGISGIELTSAIRSWEKLKNKPPIPIVALTAHSGEAEAKKCVQAGIHKVLIKPATFKLIQDVIDEFIGKNKCKAALLLAAANNNNIPAEKADLFNLSAAPLLDFSTGISILGNEQLFINMLTLMLNQGIDEDRANIVKAYEKKQWDVVQSLAHKMKGGAAYCGMIKMQMACEHLERYQKTGKLELLEPLYQQLLTVIDSTKEEVTRWLEGHKV